MSKEPKNEVAPAAGTSVALPKAMLSMYESDSQTSSGFENVGIADCAIPYLMLLNSLSKAVKGSTKVEGAEEGDFFNTVTKKVYKKQVEIICCGFEKAYVEWKPRESGGGFVEKHMTELITKKDAKNKAILPNGNILETTAYHYLLILNPDGNMERAVASLTSTQLKHSRLWVSLMRNLQIADSKGEMFNPPMFSHSYTAKSFDEKNDKGEWKSWSFSAPKLVTNPSVYKAARMFHLDVKAGQVKIEAPVSEGDAITEPIDSAVM